MKSERAILHSKLHVFKPILVNIILVVSLDFYINRRMFIRSLVHINSEKRTDILHMQITLKSVLRDHASISSNTKLLCEINNLMIALNRYLVGFNSLLLTENWPNSIWVFSVSMSVRFFF